MTGTPNPDRSAVVPNAALVHLSGRRRGATEFIPGDRIVLSPASDGGIELSTSDETPPQSLAVLERRGHTFGLTVTPGTEVWINGERLDELVLASGDVLEFGGGAVLRYRLYPPERQRYKTMAEAFSDCVECARYDSPSPIRRAAVFASRVPPEIMTQTAPRVRWLMVVLVVGAIGLASTALVRSARVERTLHTEVARVEGLARLLDRPENRALTATDLEAIRAMIARSQREILPVLEARGEVDFWEVARVLADGGHIAPLATRGIVGQITATSVVYDADTTHGGSGGPVISLDGAVVAINAAILTDFAGSNLGVPAAEALRLLTPPPETT